MSIEIQTPELERRIREGIQSGRFQDMDDLLTKALDALSESSGRNAVALDWSQCPAVESVPGKVSGASVLRNTRMPVAAVFENLEGRKIAIVELSRNRWRLVQRMIRKIVAAINGAEPGSYTLIEVPIR